jgi:hypothetical protein
MYMSDTTVTPVIKIENADAFRTVAKEYGVPVGERGRLPKRALFEILLPLIISGEIKFIPTEFFSQLDAVGTVKGEKKIKPSISYRINYHVLNKNGKPMPGTSVTLTQNEIKSYLPNVKGMVNVALATMAVALHRAKDGAVLTDLNKYVVSDVVKIETMPGTGEQTVTVADDANTDAQSNAEDTNDTSKGENTGEAVSNADSDAETEESTTHELISA